MAQVFVLSLPTWETQMKLVSPGFGLSLAMAVAANWEVNHQIEDVFLCVSLYVILNFKINCKD